MGPARDRVTMFRIWRLSGVNLGCIDGPCLHATRGRPIFALDLDQGGRPFSSARAALLDATHSDLRCVYARERSNGSTLLPIARTGPDGSVDLTRLSRFPCRALSEHPAAQDRVAKRPGRGAGAITTRTRGGDAPSGTRFADPAASSFEPGRGRIERGSTQQFTTKCSRTCGAPTAIVLPRSQGKVTLRINTKTRRARRGSSDPRGFGPSDLVFSVNRASTLTRFARDARESCLRVALSRFETGPRRWPANLNRKDNRGFR